MGDRIDTLFQQWNQLGGAVMLADVDRSAPVSEPETLIAESTAHCRESGRLTWVVLDWLLAHVDGIDTETLLAETQGRGDLSVLGVLADAANQRIPHPKFEHIMRTCPPNQEMELFFHRVAQSRLASQIATDEALDLFKRWNYLSNELRYLQDG